jgi:opacity protein-like surface antigen
MQRTKTLAAYFLGAALTAWPVFAQANQEYRSDATVQALGSFVKSTTENGAEQSATHSGGVLGTYRFYFTRHHGVELNYGYALNTQNYVSPAITAGVNAYAHEASAAYVLRFPLARVTPFVLAGAGGLIFQPRDGLGASTQGRAAFVYGGGADVNITSRIFFRAQYRGLVYSSPDFGLLGLPEDRVTHRAEPSAGFGFRF